MDRRQFLGSSGLALGATLLGTRARAASKQQEHPNIVFVFSDEHRYQSMAHTELPALQTPHMARMAREGYAYRQCISNYPVCSPYRGILLSGRWPQQTGVIDNNIPLAPSNAAIGHPFQAAGYKTGYIGKWHLGGTRAEQFGFDHSLIWTNTNTHYDASQYHPANGNPVQPKGYNATLMTDQALEFLSTHKNERFFLMLSLNPPHASFTDPPPEKMALYPPGSLPHRPNYTTAVANADGPSISKNNGSPHYEGYHAHISAIDDELGRIMGALESLDLTNNTLLIYTSDHGTMFGSHGFGSKRQCYEESIHVPYMVWQPGVVAAGGTDALLGTIDLYPTLCGMAGLPVPEHCAGQDFSPWLFADEGPDPENQFIMHLQKDNASGGDKHPAPLFRGVRTKTHTFAQGPDNYQRLYDNVADPYQLNDLSNNEEHAKLRTQLADATRHWLKQAGDAYVL